MLPVGGRLQNSTGTLQIIHKLQGLGKKFYEGQRGWHTSCKSSSCVMSANTASKRNHTHSGKGHAAYLHGRRALANISLQLLMLWVALWNHGRFMLEINTFMRRGACLGGRWQDGVSKSCRQAQEMYWQGDLSSQKDPADCHKLEYVLNPTWGISSTYCMIHKYRLTASAKNVCLEGVM